MIVFDASTLVSAAMKPRSPPHRAVRYAFDVDEVALSEATLAELIDVFARPRFARLVDLELRDEVLALLDAHGVFFVPTERVTACRDPKDNKYLELAVASGADIIVCSDDDLLVLDPWRGIRILRPASYLPEVSHGD